MKTVLYFYNPHFVSLRRRMKGLYAAAHERGWRIQPIDVWYERLLPKNMTEFWNACGAIIEGGVLENERFPLKMFERLGVPTVYCDVDLSKVGPRTFAVCHDSARTVRAAMGELMALDYPAYGYVGYRVRFDWSEVRRMVFASVVEGCGKPHFAFDPSSLGSDVSAESCFAGLKDWLRSLPRPCGILAANDEMGEWVIAAANDLKLAIPEDIAVVGIDNDEALCECTRPPLASISPDFEESGRLAVLLLARRIRCSRMKPVVELFGNAPFVRRASARVFVCRDYSVAKAVEYIRLHAKDGIDVDDVARAMNTGRRTAEDRFRRFAGHSIRDELAVVRLELARRLLSDPRIALDEVAHGCGYSDVCVFRRFFKRRTGYTPWEWRKNENLHSLS